MSQTNDPYMAGEGRTKKVAGLSYLLVHGNVNVGKDKGPGSLLFTQTSIFAFRTNSRAAVAGGAMGGLLGALIGHFIDKQRAEKQPSPEYLDDPEIKGLSLVQKKIEGASLLAKLPITHNLKLEPTRLGFKFTDSSQTTVVYQGRMYKDKIVRFLVGLGY